MMDKSLKRNHRIKTLPTKDNRCSIALPFNHKLDNQLFKHQLRKVDSLMQSKKIYANLKPNSLRYSQMNRARNSASKFIISQKPLNFYLMDCGNNEQLIYKLLKERGRWSQSTNRTGNNNFIWGYITKSLGSKLKGNEVLSRIPGSSQLTNKGRLYENIQTYCSKHRLSMNFLPITFHFDKKAALHLLRQNIEQFVDFYFYVQQNTNLSNTWILKPTNLNQGRQIHLFNNFKQLSKVLGMPLGQDKQEIVKRIEEYVSRNRSLIIQKYIENPMLIGGHKFDIRIWVLVDHLGQYYIFREGYLRFTSVPYKLDIQSIKDNFIHLTNHCLQKHSPNYLNKHNLQQMSVLAQYLQANQSSASYDTIMDNIKQIIQISLKASLGNNKLQTKNQCFEIFGFDFLIDREINVRLIEANANPAITQDCQFLSQLIRKMLNDAFKLTIDKIFDVTSMNSYSIPRLALENAWQLFGKI